MPNFPSVFPFWWIALTAGIAFITSLATLWFLHRRRYAIMPRTMLGLAFVAALSVLLWRSAGNVPALNDDQIPPFSPNDFLCPILTFVSLEPVAAFRRPADGSQWEKIRAWLTIVSFVVNVLVI